MPPGQLTIRASAKEGDFPSEVLLRFIDNALSLLHGVGENLFPQAPPKWTVKFVEMKSPLTIVLSPREGSFDSGSKTQAEVIVGMRGIEKHDIAPESFDKTNLKQASQLGMALNRSLKSWSFEDDTEGAFVPAGDFRRHVLRAMQARNSSHIVFTTLRGTLETVSIHGRNPQFVVYDFLDKERVVKCFFDKRRVDEISKLVSRRVAITGTALFDRNNLPVEITATDWRELRSGRDFGWLDKDPQKINITDGMDARTWTLMGRERDA